MCISRIHIDRFFLRLKHLESWNYSEAWKSRFDFMSYFSRNSLSLYLLVYWVNKRYIKLINIYAVI